MTASHVTATPKIAGTQSLKAVTAEYLTTCHKEFIAWLFEQAAKGGYHILLVLAGLISEATNWF